MATDGQGIGYLIMAVREARWSREALFQGDTFQALNRLMWAYRFLGNAEPTAPAVSYARAERAVRVAVFAIAGVWSQRYAHVRRVVQADDRNRAGGRA